MRLRCRGLTLGHVIPELAEIEQVKNACENCDPFLSIGYVLAFYGVPLKPRTGYRNRVIQIQLQSISMVVDVRMKNRNIEIVWFFPNRLPVEPRGKYTGCCFRLLYTASHPAAWMYFSVCGLVGLGTAFLFILVTQRLCLGSVGWDRSHPVTFRLRLFFPGAPWMC